MSRYVVTGGAGFIGSTLVEALLRQGQEVTVLDNFSTGKRENLEPFMHRIKLIEGDIRDLETCREAASGADYILHQAALGSVPRSVEDPLTTHLNNVNGTLNMLIAARDAGVKKIVLASSSSAYGDAKEAVKKETLPPAPLSPYAVSKLAAEQYAAVFYGVYGLPAVCLRYFNVFGPKQDPLSQYAAVIPRFVTKLLRREKPEIYGDGEQSRDFTYIDNVVAANLLACAAGTEANGKVFNIACGEQISLRRLYRACCDMIGTDIEPAYLEARKGDVKHSLADVSEAKRLLGYEPKVGFEEGLRQTIGWYARRHREDGAAFQAEAAG